MTFGTPGEFQACMPNKSGHQRKAQPQFESFSVLEYENHKRNMIFWTEIAKFIAAVGAAKSFFQAFAKLQLGSVRIWFERINEPRQEDPSLNWPFVLKAS